MDACFVASNLRDEAVDMLFWDSKALLPLVWKVSAGPAPFGTFPTTQPPVGRHSRRPPGSLLPLAPDYVGAARKRGARGARGATVFGSALRPLDMYCLPTTAPPSFPTTHSQPCCPKFLPQITLSHLQPTTQQVQYDGSKNPPPRGPTTGAMGPSR
ncbi:hypothetical protein CONLIGDRAFT_431335 [Coniochaeta ligniaria NRRL 30616]|uniref:Uncharacterized protein n=1 Tax=Coniochaeta ligniaria NRRL 30616 TaxID=1408157 RepID=A0A1J7IIB0_9PEZI|nr:hypothetical protein CONLIGDRAFT_431335 [Coniochaeta ligniaria NRRL 30616]